MIFEDKKYCALKSFFWKLFLNNWLSGYYEHFLHLNGLNLIFLDQSVYVKLYVAAVIIRISQLNK